ncbi:hypothetical protein ABPG72_001973 [Tetrahymena utriculariae]
MITNTRKYIKKNSVESFKYDAIYLHDSYCTLVNEAISSKVPLFGMQKCLSTVSFSDDIKECRRRLTILRSQGAAKQQEKQDLKAQIRAFLDRQNAIKLAFIQTEFEIFEQLSQEAVLQSRKHSCNMIFYNNVLKKRQEIINYFGIDFMSAEDEENILTE